MSLVVRYIYIYIYCVYDIVLINYLLFNTATTGAGWSPFPTLKKKA